MLTIYPVILETIEMLRPMMGRIDRHDRDLGRQLRRAASSIALGVAEGMYSRGRNRPARYHTALGSARETMACLEVAVAMGYLDSADAAVLDRLSRIIGTLVRLVQRHA
ncbi:MAG: four helix bundle protein [Deltaproteobacteria bacterium]|nr:four helix bundle protein [Nannocystaceae bacterium]